MTPEEKMDALIELVEILVEIVQIYPQAQSQANYIEERLREIKNS